MIVGVPSETRPMEKRVALDPDCVVRLCKIKAAIHVQAGAGLSAGFSDEAYIAAGATMVANAAELFKTSDVIAKVDRLTSEEIQLCAEGIAVIAFLAPLGDPEYVQELAARNLTAFSMDAIPQITRSQGMDALSSQSNIAGYKAVLLAANSLPKFFPMLTTAAGTVPPAKVLVLGAGVAGLQAIATARRLGAVVSAYDTRAVVKEQVQSLGAKFVELDIGEDAQGKGGYAKDLSPEAAERQRKLMQQHIGASDVVITTALVPGRKAPILITAEAVAAMSSGSVIVDLAAEAGGNCELTKPGETAVVNGVTIIGLTNLPATLPMHASKLYARNVTALLEHLIKDGELHLDFDDEITRETCITRGPSIAPAPTLSAVAQS